MKPVIHFSHGNGFPAQCYSQLLGYLEKHYQCTYIDKIGHHPDYPVTENWHFLVAEVLASIPQKTSQPVIALGHSLGGVLSLLAALERPYLFQAVVMIDAPILGWIKSRLVLLAKSMGLIDHITPAYRTKGRRRSWQSRAEVYQYLKSKPLFKHFTPACLDDYVQYGLEENHEGFHLRFDPHIEYQIYRTIPHDLYLNVQKLPLPVFLIYGKQSQVVDRFDVYYMRTRYQIHCIQLPGTHMLPMEIPEKLAEKIFEILSVRSFQPNRNK